MAAHTCVIGSQLAVGSRRPTAVHAPVAQAQPTSPGLPCFNSRHGFVPVIGFGGWLVLPRGEPAGRVQRAARFLHDYRPSAAPAERVAWIAVKGSSGLGSDDYEQEVRGVQ